MAVCDKFSAENSNYARRSKVESLAENVMEGNFVANNWMECYGYLIVCTILIRKRTCLFSCIKMCPWYQRVLSSCTQVDS